MVPVLASTRPCGRRAPHAVLERAVHARDGQAVPEGGRVAVAVHGREQGHHAVRRDEVGAREPGAVLQRPAARGSTPMRRRNSVDRVVPRLHRSRRPSAAPPSRRSSISVCRFWLGLFTTFSISARGGLSCAASTRAPAGSGSDEVATAPRHADAPRCQDLREDGGRVARGILERDRERPTGSWPTGSVPESRTTFEPEVALAARARGRRPAGAVVAVETTR